MDMFFSADAAIALLWGGVTGGALLLGALAGTFLRIPQRVVALIMAFGVGVLISALSFEIMEEAAAIGGVSAAAIGFCGGVILYAVANAGLDALGARHRKRAIRPTGARTSAAGMAIALGALIDGVPESAAIGLSLLDGEGVALVAVIAIALSNIPEGLSSSAGLRRDGRSTAQILGLWGAIAMACAVSSWFGYSVLGLASPAFIGAAMAVAAGAILVMLVQTMIPEAFEDLHALSGPVAAIGFVLAFLASHLAG